MVSDLVQIISVQDTIMTEIIRTAESMSPENDQLDQIGTIGIVVIIHREIGIIQTETTTHAIETLIAEIETLTGIEATLRVGLDRKDKIVDLVDHQIVISIVIAIITEIEEIIRLVIVIVIRQDQVPIGVIVLIIAPKIVMPIITEVDQLGRLSQ
jgi:hypothetical protein